jgi:hypothetical protein
MTMLERIATALEQKLKGDGFCSYQDAAIEAVKAMREPDYPMIYAGDAELSDEMNSFLGPAPAPVWRAMIDAILTEATQPQEQGGR